MAKKNKRYYHKEKMEELGVDIGKEVEKIEPYTDCEPSNKDLHDLLTGIVDKDNKKEKRAKFKFIIIVGFIALAYFGIIGKEQVIDIVASVLFLG